MTLFEAKCHSGFLILNRVVNSLNAVYIGLAYFHLGLWGNPHPFGHAETVKRLS